MTDPLTFVTQTSSTILRNAILLTVEDWNDWYEWRTLFYATYFDADGKSSTLGYVKIADPEHEYKNSADAATPVPESFTELPARYFSVGQDESFYENLREFIGQDRALHVLEALRDLAATPERMPEALQHRVVSQSLLRSVGTSTVTETYARLLRGLGQAGYSFSFVKPQGNLYSDPLVLRYEVEPNALPPTNVHVLVGRNGAGKTTILKDMARALLGAEAGRTAAHFRDSLGDGVDISNLVYVAFSAFDRPGLPVEDSDDEFSCRYSYVGLMAKEENQEGLDPVATIVTRPVDQLASAFSKSAWVVARARSRKLWESAISTLESDPLFEESRISELARSEFADLDESDFARQATSVFDELSSGHKIVLLTVTRLIETVTAKTLVLIDEPEGHLHPPLLSAFIRALSELLNQRNGVAIVATHSPVVLQEVPSLCVLRISRSGDAQAVEPIGIETFGESVGVLTTSVFGLEVSDSGFYKLLRDATFELWDYEKVMQRFGSRLGNEGRALVSTWLLMDRTAIQPPASK